MKFSTSFVSATREYASFYNEVKAPYFRKSFEIGKVKKAEITICGLGFYEIYINGKNITKSPLASFVANPDNVLYYDNYDLTEYLAEGGNTLAFVLGTGFLNSFSAYEWSFDKARFNSASKLAFTFEAELENGESVEFDATEGVKCAESPICMNEIRAGEIYDARLEIENWNGVDFDDSKWSDALKAEAPRGDCTLCFAEPIEVIKELKAEKIYKGTIGVYPPPRANRPDIAPLEDEVGEGYIYDFGENAAGNIRLNIKNAKKGQKLVIQYGEMLDKNGNLDLRAMSACPFRFNHRDIYICKGEAEEVYSPRFTYHGFQFALVIGLTDQQATKDALTYLVMTSLAKENAGFRCSDETLNTLWKLTKTSDRANFIHIPTDCPTREKNGWTGDAAVSAEQFIMAFTPENNFRLWLNDVRKSMNSEGAIPGIVPTAGWGFAWGNGPVWDSALINLPYYTWLYRGDKEILRENAHAIFRYISYITTRRDSRGLIHIGLGDWVEAPRCHWAEFKAPLELTDTITCIDICKKAMKIFEVLGMNAQKVFAETVYNEFMAAAKKHLINKGTLTALGNCQTSQTLAIYFDLFESGEKQGAFNKLLEMIDEQNGTFNIGMIGLRYMFHLLSDFGRTDLAYKLITQDKYPSYYTWIKQGATSLCESFRRDCDPLDSRNHHFLGDIISWYMKNLVGININPFADNEKTVHFAPKFISELDNAEGYVNTVCGRVSAKWHREGDVIKYTVNVPEGISARLILEANVKTEDGFGYRDIYTAGETTFTIYPAGKYDLHDAKDSNVIWTL